MMAIRLAGIVLLALSCFITQAHLEDKEENVSGRHYIPLRHGGHQQRQVYRQPIFGQGHGYGNPSRQGRGQVPYDEGGPRRAVVVLRGPGQTSGVINLDQQSPNTPVIINGRITGLSPGPHGLHFHELGDLSNGCTSAGPHYNPFGRNHGSPQDPKEYRHIGDLGNIEADRSSNAIVYIEDPLITLYGRLSVIGRSLVVHERVDDLGRGGNQESANTGNSGGRLACGVVGLAQNRGAIQGAFRG